MPFSVPMAPGVATAFRRTKQPASGMRRPAKMLMELVQDIPTRSGVLDFSNDGKRLLTGSMDKTVRVWEVDTGKVILTLNAGAMVWSAVFSPDGQRILTGGFDRIARIWDAGTGRAIMSFPGHTEQIRGVAFQCRWTPNRHRL